MEAGNVEQWVAELQDIATEMLAIVAEIRETNRRKKRFRGPES